MIINHAGMLSEILRSALLIVALSLSSCASDVPVQEATAAAASICEPRDFNVYFDEWQADLSNEARRSIATVQEELKGCAIEHVRIVGLAGAAGDPEANMNVSARRAETIARALEEGGWPRSVFELVAAGEEGAAGEDGMAKPMRRRAHVIVAAAAPAT